MNLSQWIATVLSIAALLSTAAVQAADLTLSKNHSQVVAGVLEQYVSERPIQLKSLSCQGSFMGEWCRFTKLSGEEGRFEGWNFKKHGRNAQLVIQTLENYVYIHEATPEGYIFPRLELEDLACDGDYCRMKTSHFSR